jgi:HPt (histidine-containing phosphotransfer) domain-containing protein
MPTTTKFDQFPLLDETKLRAVQTAMAGKMLMLVRYYLEDTSYYLERMEQALAEQNVVGLIPPAHTAKSGSRQLGLMRAGEIAAAIEILARQELQRPGGLPAITRCIDQLKHTFEESRTALTAAIAV